MAAGPKACSANLLCTALLGCLLPAAFSAAGNGGDSLRVLMCGGAPYSHLISFTTTGQELVNQGHSVRVGDHLTSSHEHGSRAYGMLP